MVILSACPTDQPADAGWYRCSLHSDTPMTLSISRVYDSLQRVMGSQLNRWLLKRRRASVQRLTATAPIRRCCPPAVSFVSVNRDERPHPDELSRCVVLLLMRAAISLSYDG